jgi:hypothetical protein
MSEDSESFQQLQRLLALKRHEQPPPGYFHQFSHGVILRIKAGELGEPEGKWWAFDGSWLRWLWTACERRPVLAGGAGVAFCGFFVAAAFISGAGDVPAVSQNLSASPQYVAVHPTLAETPTEADYSVSSADFPGSCAPPWSVLSPLFSVRRVISSCSRRPSRSASTRNTG